MCSRAQRRGSDGSPRAPGAVGLAAGCAYGLLGAAADDDRLLEFTTVGPALVVAIADRNDGPVVAAVRVVPMDGLADRCARRLVPGSIGTLAVLFVHVAADLRSHGKAQDCADASGRGARRRTAVLGQRRAGQAARAGAEPGAAQLAGGGGRGRA